ncbi:MAG: Hsp70 family protein, partial [Myxococcota bacterium]
MSRYVVGIDLGTTNTVVAYSPLDRVSIEVFSVPQVVAPFEVAALEHLPSTLYLPSPQEFAPSAGALPFFAEEPGYFVGRFAAAHGVKVPGRAVTSSKSWLSYGRVDRTAAILPWGSPEDVPRISPVEAARRTLAHVRAAWDHAHPDAPLAAQEVVLTVPASFDEVARELTVEAAHGAGLVRLRLLEEPQAALYDFLAAREADLSSALAGVGVALVVDVGGGTTDLSLVTVDTSAGQPPSLERIAVGDHLMLGGDNMDLAVARHVEQELTGTLGSLSAAQWGALGQASRLAKEALLGPTPPEAYGVALVGRGARVIGGGQSLQLSRARAEELLLEGFFPRVGLDESPRERERAGFTEVSLPYAQDAAIPRWIAAFLRRHQGAAAAAGASMFQGVVRPDAVLLNGGVFESPAVRTRLDEIFATWFGAPPKRLQGSSLHAAVARGAAYYGLVRAGLGVRIKGGSARSYFIGVSEQGGDEQALCIVPQGAEEGTSWEVDRTFRVMLGRPVSFHIFTSTGDERVRPGELRPSATEGLAPLPELHTVLRSPEEVPVKLQVEITEVCTLRVGLAMTADDLPSWGLQFSTRADAGDAAGAVAAPALAPGLVKKLDEAKELLEELYGSRGKKDADPKAIKNARPRLETLLGPRDEWPIAVCRELFGVLVGGKKKRRRSPDHERVYFQLAGHLLRPGTGAPLDDWRVSELWSLFDEGVQYVNEKKNWATFWLMWRRIAPGLTAEQQQHVHAAIAWHVLPQSMRQGAAPKGAKPHGLDEMLRLAVSLQR